MSAKRDFLEVLAGRMAALPEAERNKLLEYFAEMIDDRVEAGMPEAEAVSALGDPEALLRETCPELFEASAALVPLPGDAGCDAPIREINIRLFNADATVRRGPLPEGMTAQINASERQRFTWHLEDGTLSIAEAEPARIRLFQRSPALTLILPALNPEVLLAESNGGDIKIEGISPTARAALTSASGDITLRHFGCGESLEIAARSGDIDLSDADIRADCRLESLSGDIEFKRLRAARLRAKAASGDIKGDGLRAESASLNTASGDIELEDAAVTSDILCETASGDIDLRRAAAPEAILSTASGDIDARLFAAPGGIAVEAVSRSGDVRVRGDAPNGASKVRARSVSGDIRIEIISG